MKKLSLFIRFFAGLSLLLALSIGHAQSDDNPANCNELKDPDITFQMELCKAHAGCRMVMSIHNSCVKTKRFLTNLKEQIGEGVKGLFGYRKEVTSDHVFEASMDDKQRSVTQDKEWKDKADAIRDGQKKTGNEVLTGASTGGGTWTYIGEISGGKKNGQGTTFYSTGQIERGEFRDNARNGAIDMIEPDGRRSTGSYVSDSMTGMGYRLYPDGAAKYKGGFVANQRSGPGVLEFSNGTRYDGNFKVGEYSGEGVIFRNDGSIAQRGVFEKNELSVGKKCDAAGVVVAEVNKPLDEQRQRESAQLAAAEKQRVAAEEKAAADERRRQAEAAEQQRQRDAKAAADKAYRDSLAQMNAGQLFAKADEFSSAGDTLKAREVLRALVSRFPDHALAATAATQMSKMAEASSGGSSNISAITGGGASGGTGSGGVSNRPSGVSGRPFEECTNNDKANTSLISKMNAIPRNDTIKLLRGAHFASRWMLDNYSQCLPDPRAKEQVDQYRKTIAETLRTCKQLSSDQAICEVSPL
jgi:hypothetical protein